MAQEFLGKYGNVLLAASGVAINMSECVGVAFFGTNDNTYTLTLSTSFGGSYSQPAGWNPITHYYTNADNGAGTSAWSDKVTQAASNVVTIATDIAVCIHLFGSMVPDTYKYVKCTASSPGDGTLVAVLYELNAPRKPVNLPKISA
jgi:hypothetical protein